MDFTEKVNRSKEKIAVKATSAKQQSEIGNKTRILTTTQSERVVREISQVM